MSISDQDKLRESSSSRTFALAFALLALVCVIIGSLYVYFFIINGKQIQFPGGAGAEGGAFWSQYLTIMFIVLFDRYFPLFLIAFFALAFVRASISFVRAGEYGRTG